MFVNRHICLCVYVCNPFLLVKKPPKIVKFSEVFITRGKFLANVPKKKVFELLKHKKAS